MSQSTDRQQSRIDLPKAGGGEVDPGPPSSIRRTTRDDTSCPLFLQRRRRPGRKASQGTCWTPRSTFVSDRTRDSASFPDALFLLRDEPPCWPEAVGLRRCRFARVPAHRTTSVVVAHRHFRVRPPVRTPAFLSWSAMDHTRHSADVWPAGQDYWRPIVATGGCRSANNDELATQVGLTEVVSPPRAFAHLQAICSRCRSCRCCFRDD